MTTEIQVCKSCGLSGAGNYCSACGQSFNTKRISLAALLHDVFHFFTHLEKGFLFTVRQLIVAPGSMQRVYIEGDRNRYQKPFSTFFICATLAVLSRYWILKVLMNYFHSGDSSEAIFFHEYMIIFQIILVPLHALIIFLFFYKSKFNYAEIGVLILYTEAFFFIASIPVWLLKFIWNDMDTAYVELPVFVIYNVITFIYFFREEVKWQVVLKSLIIITVTFLLIQVAEDYIVQNLTEHRD